MSFQDAEGTSTAFPGPRTGNPEIARGIFQLNTAIAGFRRLVDAIGTARDTVEHRQKLVNARQSISKLVKEISVKLKAVRDPDPNIPLSKRVEDSKLTRDFQAILVDFQKAQKLSVEREAVYVPAPSPSPWQMSSALGEDTAPPDKNQEHERLTEEQKRREIFLLENEFIFNEAMIEEREQGIKDIGYQIAEVNEIFRDLAVLIHEQGIEIDGIGTNIEAAATTTANAEAQVAKASKSVKSKTSWVGDKSYCLEEQKQSK
uniref:Syntaxin-22 n=1 Tax=Anthurium amnicola TaxID=1678845 RepID=A0A1D1Z2G4_9ARAE